MKRNPGLVLFVLLFFLPCLSLLSWDFGLILDQNGSYSGTGSDDDMPEYSGSLVPRFHALIGDRGDFYISAGLGVEYESENLYFLPELLRTEFSWFFDNVNLGIGRIYYSDPLGFIAEGLFDGARASLHTRLGTFGAGAWYTGLLYKKRADIAMTTSELESYNTDLDYGNFYDTYFAPRRLLAAMDWEHPGLWERLRGKLSLLGQFDLNDAEKLHTQYLTGKLSIPHNAFIFDVGGSLGLIHYMGNTNASLAAELGAAWTLPSSFPSRLSLLGRYSSGVSPGSGIRAFVPVTSPSQGNVLETNISGITVISLDYLARFHDTFSLGLSSSYFVRNDLGTYYGYPVNDTTNSGYFLGNEFFAALYWSPVSDISVNLGGGVFLPSLGNVDSGADVQWKAELSLVISLY